MMMQQRSNVDETLFGRRKSARAQSAGSAVVHGLTRSSSAKATDPPPGAAFVTRSYLAEVRARADRNTSVNIHAKPPTPARHAAAPDAAMRKTRMLKAKQRQLKKEAEAAAKAYVAREDLEREIAREAAHNPAVAAAHMQEVEEMDEIKAFKVKMGKVRAMKEVEAQVAEKHRRAKLAKRRVVQMERHMERARQAELAEEFRAADLKRAKAREAAEELHRQLDKRAFERLLEEERLEREGEQLKRSIDAAIEEEKRQVAAKRERSRQIMLETIEANKQHQLLKQRKKQREMAQDRALARYQRKKEAEEQARLDAAEAERAEREKQFAKMRAEQERIMDNRGEEDARRARKHQEQRILAERKAEAAKEAQRKALYDEVVRDREAQIRFKQQQREREIVKEKVVVRRARRAAAAAAVAERAEYEALRSRALENQQDVLNQIAQRKQVREAAAQVKFREKEAVAKKEAERAIRIQMMKERKLKELSDEGISYEAQARAGLFAPDKVRIW